MIGGLNLSSGFSISFNYSSNCVQVSMIFNFIFVSSLFQTRKMSGFFPRRDRICNSLHIR